MDTPQANKNGGTEDINHKINHKFVLDYSESTLLCMKILTGQDGLDGSCTGDGFGRGLVAGGGFLGTFGEGFGEGFGETFGN